MYKIIPTNCSCPEFYWVFQYSIGTSCTSKLNSQSTTAHGQNAIFNVTAESFNAKVRSRDRGNSCVARKSLITRILHKTAPWNFRGLIYIINWLPTYNAPRLPPLPPLAVAAFGRTKERLAGCCRSISPRRAEALLLGAQASHACCEPLATNDVQREAWSRWTRSSKGRDKIRQPTAIATCYVMHW